MTEPVASPRTPRRSSSKSPLVYDGLIDAKGAEPHLPPPNRKAPEPGSNSILNRFPQFGRSTSSQTLGGIEEKPEGKKLRSNVSLPDLLDKDSPKGASVIEASPSGSIKDLINNYGKKIPDQDQSPKSSKTSTTGSPYKNASEVVIADDNDNHGKAISNSGSTFSMASGPDFEPPKPPPDSEDDSPSPIKTALKRSSSSSSSFGRRISFSSERRVSVTYTTDEYDRTSDVDVAAAAAEAAIDKNAEEVRRMSLLGLKSVKSFVITTAKQNLGIEIAEESSPKDSKTKHVYITAIVPNSPAASDGRLKVGDQLVNVGTVDLIECGLETAKKELKSAAENNFLLDLKIARDDDDDDGDAVDVKVSAKTPEVVDNVFESPERFPLKPEESIFKSQAIDTEHPITVIANPKLEKELAETKEELEKTIAYCTKMETKLEESKVELDKTIAYCTRMESKLEEKESQHKDLEVTINALKAAVANLNSRNQQLADKSQEQEEIIFSLKKELEAAKTAKKAPPKVAPKAKARVSSGAIKKQAPEIPSADPTPKKSSASAQGSKDAEGKPAVKQSLEKLFGSGQPPIFGMARPPKAKPKESPQTETKDNSSAAPNAEKASSQKAGVRFSGVQEPTETETDQEFGISPHSLLDNSANQHRRNASLRRSVKRRPPSRVMSRRSQELFDLSMVNNGSGEKRGSQLDEVKEEASDDEGDKSEDDFLAKVDAPPKPSGAKLARTPSQEEAEKKKGGRFFKKFFRGNSNTERFEDFLNSVNGKAPQDWSVEEVLSWVHTLKGVDAGKCNPYLQKNKINGAALLTMAGGDSLKDIGITSVGSRNNLRKAVKELLTHMEKQ